MKYIILTIVAIIFLGYIFVQRARGLKKKYENITDEEIIKTVGKKLD